MMKILRNEKGIALAMVLVLSVVLLAIMAGLISMLTSWTQISGMQKRYYTATEAAKGGLELTYLAIGSSVTLNPTQATANLNLLFNTTLPSATHAATSPALAACQGTTGLGEYAGTALTGLPAKLHVGSRKADGTLNWGAGCNTSVAIDPTQNATYDLTFDFSGPNGTYRVYSKIVETVEGLVGPDTGLSIGGTVAGNGAQAGSHFVYTIEALSQNTSNPAETSRFSVLYLY